MDNNMFNKTTRVLDKSLKFVQQNFNTSDLEFIDIVRQLAEYANSPSETARRNKSDRIKRNMASKLSNELKKITILTDIAKYKKFERLGNLGLDANGLREVYRVSDEIIKDINVAREWLKSYERFRRLSRQADNIDVHSELIMLGKSILGRAIELTPMKTGYLRSSGVMYDMGDYIIIAFIAPYASYVHENLEIGHPHHASNVNCGGRAKFLEVALQEFFPDRQVWTEIHGYGGVMVKIGINPLLLEYSHYN